MADPFDAAFDTILADLNTPAGDESLAADPTAIEAAVPDDVSSPDEDDAQEEADAEDVEVQAATGPNWDDESNPYRQAAFQAEQQRQQALNAIRQAAQIQQRNERNQRIQQAMAELPNLDPDQLNGSVQRLLVDAIAPFAQEAQQTRAEVEQLAKVETVRVISQRFGLTPEDAQGLHQFNHPMQMEQYANAVSTSRKAAADKQSELQKQVAALSKQLKAQSRNPNADIAGGTNGGSPPKSTKQTSSDPFDQYWADNNMDQVFAGRT